VPYLGSSDVQLGFKKRLDCRNAIFALKYVVEHFIKFVSTVNVCLLDMSKAFDKVNHKCTKLQFIHVNGDMQ